MRAFPLCLLFLLAACSSRPSTAPLDGGLVQLGGACSQSTDCGPEMLCGFPVSAGCGAQGICVQEDVTCEGDGPVVCACEGGPVELACIWGSGFAPVPVVSTTPGCQPDFDAGLFD